MTNLCSASLMRLGMVTGAVLAMGLVSAPAVHAETEVTIATLAPSGSPWMAVLDKSAAEIKEKTGSRVKVKYFEGGQQGDERDFIRKIKLGQLDGAAVTSIGLSMIDESIRVLELPMMFESVEEVDFVADKLWPYFQKKFEKKGFKLNDRGEVGWIYFISKTKIETLKDLQGQKIWQWGDDQLVGAMFKKFSLSGVPLGVPEVDAGLTSGRITACYGSPIAAVALQWYTKVKFMTSMPMTFAMGATVMSKEVVKKISPEDFKTIESIAKAAQKKLRKVIRKANEDAKTTMQRKGVQIVTSSPEMIADFTKAADEISKELKVYSKEELATVIKHRDECRKK